MTANIGYMVRAPTGQTEYQKTNTAAKRKQKLRGEHCRRKSRRLFYIKNIFIAL